MIGTLAILLMIMAPSILSGCASRERETTPAEAPRRPPASYEDVLRSIDSNRRALLARFREARTDSSKAAVLA